MNTGVFSHRLFLFAFISVAFGFLSITVTATFAACAQEEDIRPSALAGSWYPAEADALQKTVDELLGQVSAPDLYGELRALIVPHAGYQYSGFAAAVGYKCIGKQEIGRVIILAPSHYYPLRNCSVPSFSAYRTPLGDVPLDVEACDQLRKNSLIGEIRKAHEREHSIEIQLPFLQRTLDEFKLVPVLIGSLDDNGIKQAAEALRPLLDNTTLLVVSSDFTHYGARFEYEPFKTDIARNLRDLDYGAFRLIVDGDCDKFMEYKRSTGITACGALPIAVLLAAKSGGSLSMLLSYYTSAEMTGSYESSVSYGAFCFTPKRILLNEAEQQTMLRLSRDVLKSWTADGSEPQISLSNYNVTPALTRKAGVFVTLKKGSDLRGCIGTIVDVSSVVDAVFRNTQNAATRDPRFPPVTAEEADSLSIEISVLTPLQPVVNVNQIRVGVDGLVLQKGSNSGILLPQVPTEQGWNLDQFLQHICLKAGLPVGSHNSPGAKLFRFQVQKFAEKDQP